MQLVKYLLKRFKYIKRNKNAEVIKKKRYTSKQKELSNLFNDLLDTVLTDKTLKSNSQKDKNENDKTLMSLNENEIKNDKTLILSNVDDDDEMIMSSDEDDETMSQK